jgi:hypothetical protein
MKQFKLLTAVALATATVVLGTLFGPMPAASAWSNTQVAAFEQCMFSPGLYSKNEYRSYTCVKALQIALVNKHHHRLRIDGVYGDLTVAAVRTEARKHDTWRTASGLRTTPELFRWIVRYCQKDFGTGLWCRSIILDH